MKRKNITQWSEQLVSQGILDIVFADYESAEQRFGDVIECLQGRSDRFKAYVWTSAFGQGLAQGMRERCTSSERRLISEVAVAARNFYEVFVSFREMPSDPERYRTLGKSYAALGLDDEGLEILDLSRHSGILSFYRLCPEAKKLFRSKGKVDDIHSLCK